MDDDGPAKQAKVITSYAEHHSSLYDDDNVVAALDYLANCTLRALHCGTGTSYDGAGSSAFRAPTRTAPSAASGGGARRYARGGGGGRGQSTRHTARTTASAAASTAMMTTPTATATASAHSPSNTAEEAFSPETTQQPRRRTPHAGEGGGVVSTAPDRSADASVAAMVEEGRGRGGAAPSPRAARRRQRAIQRTAAACPHRASASSASATTDAAASGRGDAAAVGSGTTVTNGTELVSFIRHRRSGSGGDGFDVWLDSLHRAGVLSALATLLFPYSPSAPPTATTTSAATTLPCAVPSVGVPGEASENAATTTNSTLSTSMQPPPPPQQQHPPILMSPSHEPHSHSERRGGDAPLRSSTSMMTTNTNTNCFWLSPSSSLLPRTVTVPRLMSPTTASSYGSMNSVSANQSFQRSAGHAPLADELAALSSSSMSCVPLPLSATPPSCAGPPPPPVPPSLPSSASAEAARVSANPEVQQGALLLLTNALTGCSSSQIMKVLQTPQLMPALTACLALPRTGWPAPLSTTATTGAPSQHPQQTSRGALLGATYRDSVETASVSEEGSCSTSYYASWADSGNASFAFNSPVHREASGGSLLHPFSSFAGSLSEAQNASAPAPSALTAQDNSENTTASTTTAPTATTAVHGSTATAAAGTVTLARDDAPSRRCSGLTRGKLITTTATAGALTLCAEVLNLLSSIAYRLSTFLMQRLLEQVAPDLIGHVYRLLTLHPVYDMQVQLAALRFLQVLYRRHRRLLLRPSTRLNAATAASTVGEWHGRTLSGVGGGEDVYTAVITHFTELGSEDSEEEEDPYEEPSGATTPMSTLASTPTRRFADSRCRLLMRLLVSLLRRDVLRAPTWSPTSRGAVPCTFPCGSGLSFAVAGDRSLPSAWSATRQPAPTAVATNVSFTRVVSSLRGENALDCASSPSGGGNAGAGGVLREAVTLLHSISNADQLAGRCAKLFQLGRDTLADADDDRYAGAERNADWEDGTYCECTPPVIEQYLPTFATKRSAAMAAAATATSTPDAAEKAREQKEEQRQRVVQDLLDTKSMRGLIHVLLYVRFLNDADVESVTCAALDLMILVVIDGTPIQLMQMVQTRNFFLAWHTVMDLRRCVSDDGAGDGSEPLPTTFPSGEAGHNGGSTPGHPTRRRPPVAVAERGLFLMQCIGARLRAWQLQEVERRKKKASSATGTAGTFSSHTAAGSAPLSSGGCGVNMAPPLNVVRELRGLLRRNHVAHTIATLLSEDLPSRSVPTSPQPSSESPALVTADSSTVGNVAHNRSSNASSVEHALPPATLRHTDANDDDDDDGAERATHDAAVRHVSSERSPHWSSSPHATERPAGRVSATAPPTTARSTQVPPRTVTSMTSAHAAVRRYGLEALLLLLHTCYTTESTDGGLKSTETDHPGRGVASSKGTLGAGERGEKAAVPAWTSPLTLPLSLAHLLLEGGTAVSVYAFELNGLRACWATSQSACVVSLVALSLVEDCLTCAILSDDACADFGGAGVHSRRESGAGLSYPPLPPSPASNQSGGSPAIAGSENVPFEGDDDLARVLERQRTMLLDDLAGLPTLLVQCCFLLVTNESVAFVSSASQLLQAHRATPQRVSPRDVTHTPSTTLQRFHRDLQWKAMETVQVLLLCHGARSASTRAPNGDGEDAVGSASVTEAMGSEGASLRHAGSSAVMSCSATTQATSGNRESSVLGTCLPHRTGSTAQHPAAGASPLSRSAPTRVGGEGRSRGGLASSSASSSATLATDGTHTHRGSVASGGGGPRHAGNTDGAATTRSGGPDYTALSGSPSESDVGLLTVDVAAASACVAVSNRRTSALSPSDSALLLSDEPDFNGTEEHGEEGKEEEEEEDPLRRALREAGVLEFVLSCLPGPLPRAYRAVAHQLASIWWQRTRKGLNDGSSLTGEHADGAAINADGTSFSGGPLERRVAMAAALARVPMRTPYASHSSSSPRRMTAVHSTSSLPTTTTTTTTNTTTMGSNASARSCSCSTVCSSYEGRSERCSRSWSCCCGFRSASLHSRSSSVSSATSMDGSDSEGSACSGSSDATSLSATTATTSSSDSGSRRSSASSSSSTSSRRVAGTTAADAPEEDAGAEDPSALKRFIESLIPFSEGAMPPNRAAAAATTTTTVTTTSSSSDDDESHRRGGGGSSHTALLNRRGRSLHLPLPRSDGDLQHRNRHRYQPRSSETSESFTASSSVLPMAEAYYTTQRFQVDYRALLLLLRVLQAWLSSGGVPRAVMEDLFMRGLGALLCFVVHTCGPFADLERARMWSTTGDSYLRDTTLAELDECAKFMDHGAHGHRLRRVDTLFVAAVDILTTVLQAPETAMSAIPRQQRGSPRTADGASLVMSAPSHRFHYSGHSTPMQWCAGCGSAPPPALPSAAATTALPPPPAEVVAALYSSRGGLVEVVNGVCPSSTTTSTHSAISPYRSPAVRASRSTNAAPRTGVPAHSTAAPAALAGATTTLPTTNSTSTTLHVVTPFATPQLTATHCPLAVFPPSGPAGPFLPESIATNLPLPVSTSVGGAAVSWCSNPSCMTSTAVTADECSTGDNASDQLQRSSGAMGVTLFGSPSSASSQHGSSSVGVGAAGYTPAASTPMIRAATDLPFSAPTAATTITTTTTTTTRVHREGGVGGGGEGNTPAATMVCHGGGTAGPVSGTGGEDSGTPHAMSASATGGTRVGLDGIAAASSSCASAPLLTRAQSLLLPTVRPPTPPVRLGGVTAYTVVSVHHHGHRHHRHGGGHSRRHSSSSCRHGCSHACSRHPSQPNRLNDLYSGDNHHAHQHRHRCHHHHCHHHHCHHCSAHRRHAQQLSPLQRRTHQPSSEGTGSGRLDAAAAAPMMATTHSPTVGATTTTMATVTSTNASMLYQYQRQPSHSAQRRRRTHQTVSGSTGYGTATATGGMSSTTTATIAMRLAAPHSTTIYRSTRSPLLPRPASYSAPLWHTSHFCTSYHHHVGVGGRASHGGRTSAAVVVSDLELSPRPDRSHSSGPPTTHAGSGSAVSGRGHAVVASSSASGVARGVRHGGHHHVPRHRHRGGSSRCECDGCTVSPALRTAQRWLRGIQLAGVEDSGMAKRCEDSTQRAALRRSVQKLIRLLDA